MIAVGGHRTTVRKVTARQGWAICKSYSRPLNALERPASHHHIFILSAAVEPFCWPGAHRFRFVVCNDVVHASTRHSSPSFACPVALLSLLRSLCLLAVVERSVVACKGTYKELQPLLTVSLSSTHSTPVKNRSEISKALTIKDS